MSCPESPVCSRLLDIEEKRRAYQLHQTFLMKTKYQIDTTRPQTAPRILRYEKIRKKEIIAQKNAEMQNTILMSQFRQLHTNQPSSPAKNKFTPLKWTDILQDDSIRHNSKKKSSQKNPPLFSPKARGHRQILSHEGMVVSDELASSPLRSLPSTNLNSQVNSRPLSPTDESKSPPVSNDLNSLQNVLNEATSTLGGTRKTNTNNSNSNSNHKTHFIQLVEAGNDDKN